jgi:hypothetical protein
MILRLLPLFVAGLALGACADGAQKPDGLRISVGALSLPGIGGACYDLQVSNGTDVVWSLGDPTLTALGADQTLDNGPDDDLDVDVDTETVCSGQFGNATGGDITYIGPCDASTDSDGNLGNGVQNLVTLWVDGLYNAGSTADIGAWRDPCGATGCQLQVACNENADSQVVFNLAIMRSANQGFFDIAVNFEDIFCSAKFDTCYSTSPERKIELLHGADSGRDWTGVFGFACTAGADSETRNIASSLLFSRVLVTCGATVYELDPRALEGNAETADATPLHYGVYRGTEQLDCGDGSCNKLYWNLALSIDDLIANHPTASCTLSLEATADDVTPNNTGVAFANGLPTGNGVSYPYIKVEAPLTNVGQGLCQVNALDQGSVVATAYRGNLGGYTAPVVMCSSSDGTAVAATGGNSCP